MKIKKIGAICNACGVYYLMDQKNAVGETVYQWLGDGKSAYPLVGMPTMDVENICAMFDITDKKREKLVMRQFEAPNTMNWEDTDSFERRLDDPKLCVRYDGRDLLPLETSAGITFIQEKYLLPLDGMDYMQLYERKSSDGRLYIVAKIGMILQAVIMPMDVVTDDLVDRLDELTRMCRSALLEKNRMQERRKWEAARADAVDKGQDTLFQGGEDAGEGTGE